MHVVWDWNGTLLDDLHEVVESVNEALRAIGENSITARQYGTHYTRPVRRFYDSLLGRPITDAEWHTLDEVFHDVYRDLVPDIRLAPDALEALQAVLDAGHTQSLLSMLWHHELVPMVDRFGLEPYLRRVEGLRGERGARKEGFLVQHLASLCDGEGMEPSHVLMIGDALDDADAARAVGTRCVLYDRGTFPRTRIEAAGVPTAGTLLGALETGGVLGSRY